MTARLLKIPPKQFAHLQDVNLGIAKLIVGPKTYTTKTNEVPIYGPAPFVVIPPNNYVIVRNPHRTDPTTNQPLVDSHGQVQLQHGRQQVRHSCEPFPLYPGEELVAAPQPMPKVAANAAVLLSASWDLKDATGVKRKAGERWLFEGPGVLLPHYGVTIVERRDAVIIGVNQALRVAALQDCVDRDGKKRVCGEHWLVKQPGAYLLQAYEKMIQLLDAVILTPTNALHVKAWTGFVDEKGVQRKIGEEYLITMKERDTFIPNVHEEIVAHSPLISLGKMQYCVIENPIDPETRVPQYGKSEIRRGEKQFFLQPGEILRDGGLRNVVVIDECEALCLLARQNFEDEDGKQRVAGSKWMIRGPREYVPPLQVSMLSLNTPAVCIEAIGLYAAWVPHKKSISNVTPLAGFPQTGLPAKTKRRKGKK